MPSQPHSNIRWSFHSDTKNLLFQITSIPLPIPSSLCTDSIQFLWQMTILLKTFINMPWYQLQALTTLYSADRGLRIWQEHKQKTFRSKVILQNCIHPLAQDARQTSSSKRHCFFKETAEITFVFNFVIPSSSSQTTSSSYSHTPPPHPDSIFFAKHNEHVVYMHGIRLWILTLTIYPFIYTQLPSENSSPSPKLFIDIKCLVNYSVTSSQVNYSVTSGQNRVQNITSKGLVHCSWHKSLLLRMTGGKMKLNEQGKQKLGKQNFQRQKKHAQQYSGLLQIRVGPG